MSANRRTSFPFATTMTRVTTVTMLGMLACETPTPDEAEVNLRDVASEVCPAGRQIARKPASMTSCPTVVGWTKLPVFPGAPPDSALASFCRYASEGEPSAVQLAALDKVGLLAHDPDCDVVFEQGDAMSSLGPSLRTIFREGIGHADASDLDLPNTAAGRARVGVAVVDSWPDAGYAARSQHGPTMKRIISDIACPQAGSSYSCPIVIDGRLALARYDAGQVDLLHGGYYGSMAELAASIYAAVNAWTAAVPADDAPRLVINLSVGWDPAFGDRGERTAADAVHVALRYAACRGAILVAAAGNEDENCSEGPLLPGGWEDDSAPTQIAECEAIGAGGLVSYGAGYRPLVYSVGGLRFDDELMPRTRPEGMPRLAARATHAVAGEAEPTTALTGTSVSAAVVSGTAALVWSLDPTLTADEVMAMIYDAGETSPFVADYPDPGVPVQQVDVCATVNEVCDQLPGCTLPLDCLSAGPTLDTSDIFAEVDAMDREPTSTPSFGVLQECLDSCQPRYAYKVAEVSEACPVAAPALAFTVPQPTQVACPNCTIKTSGLLDASLDSTFDPLTINNVDVTLDDGTTQIVYRLGDLPLSSMTITEVQLAPVLASFRTADITIHFDELVRPVSNPLIVE